MASDEKSHPLMSSDFDWDLERPERNQEVFERYDVQKAKQIVVASPRDVVEVDLKKHAAAFQDYIEGVKLKDKVDWSKIDLSLPIIFIQTKYGKTPIDGRHRLAKALKDGCDSVPAVFLTEAETDSIRIKSIFS